MRGRRTVYRLRAPLVTDDYNNQTRDWDNQERTPIHRCDLQPVDGDEVTTDRQATVTRWRFFAPAGTDLLSTDRVEDCGEVYEVDGDVQRWSTGRRGYVTTLLRRSVTQ